MQMAVGVVAKSRYVTEVESHRRLVVRSPEHRDRRHHRGWPLTAVPRPLLFRKERVLLEFL